MNDLTELPPLGMLRVGPRDVREIASLWGLTGGIGSGKSLAGRFFAEEGFLVLDADRIARELSSPGGKAHPAIEKRFGSADRIRLRELVFTDAKARADLEAILHPLIRVETWLKIFEWMKEKKLPLTPPVPVIYEAALLIETGRYRTMTGLISVIADRETRITRVTTRDGTPKALVEKILAAQTDDATRERESTLMIQNDGTEEELRSAVINASRRIRAWDPSDASSVF